MLYPDTALLDAPELQHFHHESGDSLLPSQIPPLTRQITEIVIANSSPSHPLLVKLVIDAAPGCGGVAWPAGRTSVLRLIIFALASYLLQRKSLEGLTIVELGGGTGLVGIVAGLSCAKKVWITDQEPLIELMRANVSLNGLDSSVHVEALDWGTHLPASMPPEPDLVLAADCVYFEPTFLHLVQTLSALAKSPRTEILLCYKKRRKADKRFFIMLKKEFTCALVSDDPSYSDNVREGIFLYRLVKKTGRKVIV